MALKAAVRPLVKRLDPAFDERNFGFATFTELLRALDGRIAERPGEYDHGARGPRRMSTEKSARRSA